MQLAADLDFLTGREEFQRFMLRLAKRRDAMSENVLTGDMTAEAREIERQRFLLLDELVKSPETDRATAARELDTRTISNTRSISS